MFRAQTTFLNETKVAFLDSKKQPFAFVITRAEDVNFGDIYQGRIVKKMTGLKSSLVDIGKEAPVFLPESAALNEGDGVWVQVVKEPRPGKEAQVSLIKADSVKSCGLIRKGNLLNEEESLYPQVPWDERFDEALETAMESVVTFADGARLIIERTAAFWSIDVDSASSTLPFYDINAQAAPLIAREIIKRNLSGNILIDFIGKKTIATVKPLMTDMEIAFNQSLAPTRIFGLSRLGNIEIRRQRQRSALTYTMTSTTATAYRLFKEILACPSPFITIEVSPILYKHITGALCETWQSVERKKGTRLTLKTNPSIKSFTIMEK